jgi:hypothetical protein
MGVNPWSWELILNGSTVFSVFMYLCKGFTKYLRLGGIKFRNVSLPLSEPIEQSTHSIDLSYFLMVPLICDGTISL